MSRRRRDTETWWMGNSLLKATIVDVQVWITYVMVIVRLSMIL
jgi:hypothetical protein